MSNLISMRAWPLGHGLIATVYSLMDLFSLASGLLPSNISIENSVLLVSAVCVFLNRMTRIGHSFMNNKRHGAIRQFDSNVLLDFLLFLLISNHRVLNCKLTVRVVTKS